MLVMGDGFGILCGETMLCLDSGKKSKIGKVNMVEDKFLYGFTGRNSSAVEFFKGLITLKLEPLEELCNMSYPQLIEMLDKQFNSYKINGAPENFEVRAIVCGELNNTLQCMMYLIKPNEYKREAKLCPILGLEVVGSYLEKHWENYNLDNQNLDIVEAIVDAFQRMVNIGIGFDDTINNEIEAYFINRGCDKPYITQKLK